MISRIAIDALAMGGETPPPPKYTSLIYDHFDMRKGVPPAHAGGSFGFSLSVELFDAFGWGEEEAGAQDHDHAEDAGEEEVESELE